MNPPITPEAERVLALEKILQGVSSSLDNQTIVGMLKWAIHDHGPITEQNMSSAAKRIGGKLRALVPHVESRSFIRIVPAARLNRLALAETYLLATEAAWASRENADDDGEREALAKAQWAKRKYYELFGDEERANKLVAEFVAGKD